jgi:hypothetical protein
VTVTVDNHAKKYLERLDADMQRRIKDALRPLFTELVYAPRYETDLTDEEKTIIENGRKRYKECPDDFVTIEV